MVDPDPIMEMSRDTESDNGEEVLSQSKPNCIGLRECRISKESNLTQPEMEKICLQDIVSNDDVEMVS